MQYRVKIEDMRPGTKGQFYQRIVVADSDIAAMNVAAMQLRMSSDMHEGADYHFVIAEPQTRPLGWLAS